MRGFLINKNLCLYYWLKKRIGKESAYRVANVIEKIILTFGRGTYEAYEFYWLDPINGYQLIGTLPERRKNRSRITRASITNWVKKFFGKKFKFKDIFFIQVTIDENTGRIFRPLRFSFNSVSATVTSWSNTIIKWIVPTGATTGPVVVTTGVGASNEKSFTVKPSQDSLHIVGAISLASEELAKRK